MKKKRYIILGILLAVAIVGGGVYLWLQNLYYGERWYPGTIINGFSVGGKTLEESKSKMQEYYEDYALTVLGRENGKMLIPGDDIDYIIDVSSQWDELFQTQHGKMCLPWSKSGEYTVGYNVSYDEMKLADVISTSEIVQGSETYKINKPVSARVKYNSNQSRYTYVKEQNGNSIQVQELLKAVQQALQQGRAELNLENESECPDVYEKPKITLADEELKKEWALCNQAVTRYIRWNMGNKIVETVEPKQIAKWISYKKGAIVYNKQKISDWVGEFCLKYKTVGKTRKMRSHTGKLVSVSGGDYGVQLDFVKTQKQLQKALKKEIGTEKTEAFLSNPIDENKKSVTITLKPTYLNYAYKKDFSKNPKDWDTKNYIEVSLSEQKVYVFRKGKVAFKCRCISGLPVQGRTTPTGTYYIKEHRRDYTMKGDDYETFVKCWVRITWTGTGFHPATWQPWSRWSKTLYKTKGSHGCLNLKPDDAETIYRMSKYQEAVFIHK